MEKGNIIIKVGIVNDDFIKNRYTFLFYIEGKKNESRLAFKVHEWFLKDDRTASIKIRQLTFKFNESLNSYHPYIIH